MPGWLRDQILSRPGGAEALAAAYERRRAEIERYESGASLKEGHMSDFIVSLIRTWTPVAVGVVLTWLAAKLGVVIDESTSVQATAVMVGIVTAVWYAVARAAEEQWPTLGRFLVGAGAGAKPEYRPTDAPSSRPRSM